MSAAVWPDRGKNKSFKCVRRDKLADQINLNVKSVLLTLWNCTLTTCSVDGSTFTDVQTAVYTKYLPIVGRLNF
jgi:hypothetical protein